MGLPNRFTSRCVTRGSQPDEGIVNFGPSDYRLADDGVSVLVRAWIYSPPTTADCVVPVTVELDRLAPAGALDPVGLGMTFVDVCVEGTREPWPGWLGRQAVLVLTPDQRGPDGGPIPLDELRVTIVAGNPEVDENSTSNA